MPERKYGKEFGFNTRAVHTGNDVDKDSLAIKRPIVMANSYELPYDPTDINWSSAGKNLYTRNGGANQQYLQEKIASFEGAEDCVVLASGVGALSGLFFSLLQSGDHVIFSSVTYIAVYRLLNELFNNKFKIETSITDTTDLSAIEAAVRPNTKLIHIETPGNPTISISDIKAIAQIAHKNGALLSVDNTLASPFNQRPIELGADFSIESLTKYINGHGDAMGGSISGEKKYLDIIRAQAQINLGAVISPFNAWLIMRGSSTFPLRMRQHNENAILIAQYLESRKNISFVSYPGLKNHRGYKTAVSQMSPGFGGVLSFGIKGNKDKHNEFVSKLRLITSAVSLGHDTSLIAFLGANDERQYLYPEEFHNGFFRFSVGIEDAKDIIKDLDQALEKVGL
ncbi:MAG: aminotransferase class I/II-fold pyridoxal phosphate-dependent enzyme [Elusimicrobiota bacterium]|jgi:methionine-gamma-lyase|nr:aminotransferase class I/II-fold pyridoxal phosphate-dependent enzyme [Elusimicrobiota bacterium]